MSNTVDFRLRLQDELTNEMKKAQKISETALKSMSQEQINLTKQTHKYENAIVELKNKLHSASKQQQKDIKEEIRLNQELLRQSKKQLTEANKQQRIKTGNTLSGQISKGVSEGMPKGGGGLSSLIGKGGAIAGGAIAIGAAAYQGNQYLQKSEKESQLVKSLFSTSGDELKNLKGQAGTIVDVFGQDFNNVLLSANTLAKEMGITGSNALDLIKQGFEKGADSNGQFLDMLKEYPTQLKSIGLDAEETIAIITQSVTSGVYSDKGIDALKEGGLRLRENTKAVQDALKVFTKQTQAEIKALVVKGETFKAMQLISKEMKNLDVQARQTVFADIFGGAGEDAGKFITTLDTLNTSLTDVKDTTTDYQKAQLSLSEEWNKFVASVTDSEGAFNKVFTFVINSLSDILGFLNDANKISIQYAGLSQEELDKRTNAAIESFQKTITGDDKSQASQIKRKLDAQNKELERLNNLDIPTFGEGSVSQRLDRDKAIVETGISIRALESMLKGKGGYQATIIDKLKKDKPIKKSSITTPEKDLTAIAANRNVKSLTINIDALVKDGITISTTNLSESPAEIERLLTRALTNVVNQSSAQLFS